MDPEKYPETSTKPNHASSTSPSPPPSILPSQTWITSLQNFAGAHNIETYGITRIPASARTETGLRASANIFTMWFSANLVVSSFAIGLLSQSLFYLGFIDAILVCLFFNLLGVMSVCFFSTFGPAFGLRQMVLSRFWFGWYGVKLIAGFNVLACIGWSAVNSIVGAQLIHAVNNDVPGWAGIVVISVGTLLVCVFGYRIVHAYEFWSWIPSLVVFLIVLGVFAASGDFRNIPMGVGTSELGGVLSFGSVVYGFATGWTSYAADYTVYWKERESKTKAFFSTWAGLIVALLFSQFLGIAVMTATSIDDGNNRYMEGYTASGTGGLLGALLIYHLGTFGKFCLVVLALSIIANNCPNIYSVALTVQVLARWTAAVPRYVWTTVGTAVYIAIAIPGYDHFEAVLENFMNFIGYWLAIYEGISLTDHFVFKRGMQGYDPELYDQPHKLPLGFAAVGAFACGVAGMVTGMSQTWFVGPIALTAGEAPFGGDVGFELGFLFSAVAYLALRPIEIRLVGR